MKKVAVFFVTVFCVVEIFAHHGGPHESAKPNLKKYLQDCSLESTLAEDLLAGKDVESKTNLGCAATCALKKIGLMNEDGSIKKEPQTDQHLDSCRDQTGSDECEIGNNILKCFGKIKEHD